MTRSNLPQVYRCKTSPSTRFCFLPSLTAQVCYALRRLGAICFGFHRAGPPKVPETTLTDPCPPLKPVSAIEKSYEGAYPCRFKVGGHAHTPKPND